MSIRLKILAVTAKYVSRNVDMDGRTRSRYARRMRQVIDEEVAEEAAVPDAEQRILLSGVSWRKYESLLKLLGEDYPGIRVASLEGELEIMSAASSSSIA